MVGGSGESFSAPTVAGHPYSKPTPGILTDEPQADHAPADPFVTENERLQSVVLTQEDRQVRLLGLDWRGASRVRVRG